MRKRTVRHMFLAVLLLLWIPGVAGKTDALADGWRFGDQLAGREREIYELLEENYSALKNYRENGITVTFRSPMSTEEGNALDWFRIQRAFLMDHSELFWISSLTRSMIATWDPVTGVYDAPDMVVYSVDHYPEIRSEIMSAQKEIKKAVAAVKKRKGRYAKVKAAHDYVIRLVTYPKNLKPAYYHAVTGALLKKYGNKGVCEAYAWLFDIICKANGIPCVTLEGGGHAWNYVQMEDGKWYLVDTTKDDAGVVRYDYFLVGANTSVHGKKVKNTHRASSTKKLYRVNKAAALAYPALSGKAYRKRG